MDSLTTERLIEMRSKQRPTVVEVLREDQWNEYHLPDAISVPLNTEFDEHIQAAVPDKETLVVVYCLNVDCPMAGEAVERMVDLGYQNVHEYPAGKEGWKEAGLPVEH